MNKWETQRLANNLAFLTSDDYTVRKKILESVCRAFKGKDVTWALAMSSSLFFRGITDDFNDFDILISIDSIEEFEETFRSIEGANIDDNTQQKVAFTSPFYREATINGFHFDLIGNMAVSTYARTYQYVLKKSDVEFITIDGGLTIPLSPVEANFLLYGMMCGWQARRIFKRELCYDYLAYAGIKNRDVFERLAGNEDCITEDLLEDTRQLLIRDQAGI